MAEAKLEGSDEEKLAAIKAFGDEFAAIGFIPKKAISKIQKDYDAAMDKLYLDAGLKKDEVKKVRFQNKIERLAEGDKGAEQLRKEQNFLSKKLQEKEEELRQYETNMSFFANAAPDNPLLVNAQKNIQSLKVEIASLQGKIKLLKVSQRKLA